MPHEVLDGLAVLVCGLAMDGTIHVFNRACESITGMSREAAVGRNWLDLFASTERSQQVRALWARAAERAPVLPFEAPCRNNRSLRWQFSRQDGASSPHVVLWAVGLDVTDDRALLTQARTAERTLAIGNLVSGLTHELRNPLNSAMLQLAVADRTLARSSDERATSASSAVSNAIHEIRRISRILDDFMVFVRPQALCLERIDVRRIVTKSVERSAARAHAAGVSVTLDPGPATIAEVDASRVETAVYQLIANGIDAAATASERVVRVRITTPSNSVVLEVEDRGPGIASSDALVFEPFFTTKTGGTGLGLAIVQTVATDHGGTITYERRRNATVFRLELPIIGGIAN